MKRALDERTKNSIIRVVGSIILCVVLMCALYSMGPVVITQEPWTSNGGFYLGSSMMLFGVFEIIYFIYRKRNENDKYDYAYIAYAIVDIIAGILLVVFTRQPALFAIGGLIFMLIPIAKRCMSLVNDHRARNIIMSVIMFLLYTFLLISVAICINVPMYSSYLVGALIPATTVAVISLFYICRLALSHFNYRALRKIIRKTYAGEVIFGLLLLMVAFSLVLMIVEENIHNFWDAMWYCYMLVTTIGFGDITSVTVLGRIISVILGIYGIIVVAILTSIIVNFYTETRSKEEEKVETITIEDNSLEEETEEEKAEETIVEETEQDNQVETKEDEKVAE